MIVTMRKRRRVVLLCVVALGASAASIPASTATREDNICRGGIPLPREGVPTYVYFRGKEVGCVRRSSPGNWDVQEAACGWVERRAAGALYAGEGFRPNGIGRLAKANVWRVTEAGTSRTLGFVRRGASKTRWDIYRAGRKVAHTRGPDGPAAGVAFLVFYACFVS